MPFTGYYGWRAELEPESRKRAAVNRGARRGVTKSAKPRRKR